jgi:RNA polymerase sigma-70 factor (ECF subfamily)
MDQDPHQTRKFFDLARTGDADAFWQLVLPHRGLIYSVAFGILKNHERAEDQLHDVLLHAFRSIGNLRDPQRLPSWLYTMTRNKVMDTLRREERARRAVYQAAGQPKVITMSEIMEQETWLQRMEAAMVELPEPFREILALKYMNHYSIQEISQVLEISEPAVKSRLFQARKCLRRQTEELACRESGGRSTSKETRP